jgi:hypothetical protein
LRGIGWLADPVDAVHLIIARYLPVYRKSYTVVLTHL